MELRLEPEDEYMHPLEEASNFNESMYFNAYDPRQGVGGFLRLGNRPNEGYAEMTTCLYLPGGRAAFMFGRPEVHANDAFDAGGMRFDVLEPFARLRATYSGKALLLDDPLAMAHPRRAFAEHPMVDVDVEWDVTGVSPMFGGEPVGDVASALASDVAPEEQFARGHYEQHHRSTGRISVGDESWEFDGFGLRDHSWGPRYWQAPYWYRWLTANFGDDGGFMLSIITSRDGRQRTGGMVLADGAYDPVRECTIETTWRGESMYHETIQAVARTESGALHRIDGRVLSLVPLRNRRTSPDGEELTTRISEGMTEWRCDGRVGYGLSEYLDQVVDGRPVGADH